MDLITTVFIAFGLAMDCFAVSLGIGASRTAIASRPIFRLFFHFGIFQGGMTFLGWLVGASLVSIISSVDHWIAFALLSWVGVRMLILGTSMKEEPNRPDPSRGKELIMLAVATSIDALAVGLSLAMLKVDILAACLLIAGITMALSLAGLLIGNGLGSRFGKRMEIVGGLVLVGIGVRILIEHLG